MEKRNKIKINVLTEGRFHMLDLARELDAQGFDVQLYSFIPEKRTEKFGLRKKCCKSIFLPLAPVLLLNKKFCKRNKMIQKIRVLLQDLFVSIGMRECDVLISLTGSYVTAVKKAKEQGAIIIMERGSKHILEQKRIMENLYKDRSEEAVPKFNLERELKGYELADYISIASGHVRDSFLLHNYPESKLFVDPYGTDLSMFRPEDRQLEYDVIMVGGWSLRKGCDLLTEAIKDTNLKFLHVGGLVDLEFPKLLNFTHVDSVDQPQLIDYYSRAKIAVLVSHEEGLAMVQGQALACGLPLVCTKDTGGEDIARLIKCEEWVTVIPENTVAEIKKGIYSALEKYNTLPSNRDILGENKGELSWRAYGRRYAEFLDTIC